MSTPETVDREQLGVFLCDAYGRAWADESGEAFYEHCAELVTEGDTIYPAVADALLARYDIRPKQPEGETESEPAPTRYRTCIECEAHVPMQRTVATPRGPVCRACETELRRQWRKVVAR